MTTKRLSRRTVSVTAILGAATLAACGHAQTNLRDSASSGARSDGEAQNEASASASAHDVWPIGASGTGGAVALAALGGRRIALIADEDAKAVLSFDVDARKQVASTSVGGTPSQIYVARDGRVFVTVRDTSKVIAFRIDRADAPLTRIGDALTPAEPVAIAASPDEKTMFVTAGWGHKLAAFDADSLTPRFETKLAREPRGVVVSDDGKTAFVSHAVGSVLSVVDLAKPTHPVKTIAVRGNDPNVRLQAAQRRRSVEHLTKAGPPSANTELAVLKSQEKRATEGRMSCQSFVLAKSAAIQNRIFAPQVMVDPGDPETRPTGYGDGRTVPEVPAVAVIDEAAAVPLESSITIGRTTHFQFSAVRGQSTECLLPRAAAIDPQTKSLLVTCFGIDSVIAYDALSGTPAEAVRRRWNVGAGPTGIAIDANARQAIVFSQFDRTVSVLRVDDGDLVDDRSAAPEVEKTALAPLPDGLSPQMIVGRMLFHASGDVRISSDGRACASCHPDGRDDAITWATPEGPRRSIMLAGRLSKTAPYSWDGNAATVDAHLSSTFQRLKGHGGLRSSELDALVAYVSSLPAPPPRVIEDKAKVERGRQIFTSTQAGCSSCHAGADFTDGSNHDVGSKHAADRAERFNTPSLHFVGGTGPYFHDGRYATLAELLRKSDGKMGRTKHLTNADIDALQVYLETL